MLPTVQEIEENLLKGLDAAMEDRETSDAAYEWVVERMNAKQANPPDDDDKPLTWHWPK